MGPGPAPLHGPGPADPSVGVPFVVPPPKGKYKNIKVPGGWLKLGKDSLDAHCDDPRHYDADNPCRLNRTVAPKRRGSDGRPAALLLCWLAHAKDCATQECHKSSGKKSSRTVDDSIALSFTKRKIKRDWLTDEANGMKDVLAHERFKRDGEPIEPFRL